MDALTHAIEGYTTAGAWELSDCLDLEAIKLIAANLRKAVENDPDGREGMALAQYVTAMAYSNVGLGIAHSMAHTLGAVYDTPHGVVIPTKREKLKEEDLPFLCESAAADACAPGNPRPASLEQFEEMFRKLM